MTVSSGINVTSSGPVQSSHYVPHHLVYLLGGFLIYLQGTSHVFPHYNLRGFALTWRLV